MWEGLCVVQAFLALGGLQETESGAASLARGEHVSSTGCPSLSTWDLGP